MPSKKKQLDLRLSRKFRDQRRKMTRRQSKAHDRVHARCLGITVSEWNRMVCE